jgi:hypothetical protein
VSATDDADGEGDVGAGRGILSDLNITNATV